MPRRLDHSGEDLPAASSAVFVFEVSGTAAGAYADGCGEDVVAQVRELVVADGEIILGEIARERALLDRLEREAAEARARLNALEASVPPAPGRVSRSPRRPRQPPRSPCSEGCSAAGTTSTRDTGRTFATAAGATRLPARTSG